MIKKILLTLVLCFTFSSGWAAVRTISTAGGDWNNILSWDELAIPNSSDDIVCSVTSGNLTLDAAGACKSIDFTNYINTFDMSSNTLTVSGSITLVAGMTYTQGTGTTIVNSTSTITSGGKSFYNFTFSSASTFTLGDDMNVTNSLNLNNVNSGNNTINGNTLYVQGAITFNNAAGLTSGTTALNINGTGAQTWTGSTGGSSYTRVSLPITINKATGTLSITNRFQSEGSLIFTQGDVNFGSAVIYIGGSTFTWTAGTMTVGTSTVQFNNTYTIPSGFITAVGNFYAVTFAGGKTFTFGGDITVTNTLNLAPNTTETNTLNGNNLYAQGDITSHNSFTKITGTTVLNITGGANQAWTASSTDLSGTYNNVDLVTIVNKSANTLTFIDAKAAYFSQNLIFTAGNVDYGSSTICYKTGTMTYTSGIHGAGTSTLKLIGTCTLNTNGMNWYNVTFATTGTYTLTSALSVDGTLTCNTGVTATLATSDITASGSVTLNGTGIITGRTITMDGTGTWSNGTGNIASNVTINTAGTITLSGTVYYGTGTLTYISGTIVVNGSTLAIVNNCTLAISGMPLNNFTFGYPTISNITLTLTQDMTVNGIFNPSDRTGTAGTNSITSSGGVRTIHCNGDITWTNTKNTDIVLNSGTVISIEGNAVAQSFGSSPVSNNIYGDVTIAKGTGTLTLVGTFYWGDIYAGVTNATFTHTSGTVSGGTSTFIVINNATVYLNTNGNVPFNNLTIGFYLTGTTQLNSALDVNGNLLITASLGTLNANGQQINCAGNWTTNGTFTHGNNTTVFDGTTTFAGNNTTFYNLQLSSATVHLLSTKTYTVAGNFTSSGTSTLDATTATSAALLPVTGTAAVSNITATDIDSSGGTAVVDTGGTLLRTVNWTAPVAGGAIRRILVGGGM